MDPELKELARGTREGLKAWWSNTAFRWIVVLSALMSLFALFIPPYFFDEPEDYLYLLTLFLSPILLELAFFWEMRPSRGEGPEKPAKHTIRGWLALFFFSGPLLYFVFWGVYGFGFMKNEWSESFCIVATIAAVIVAFQTALVLYEVIAFRSMPPRSGGSGLSVIGLVFSRHLFESLMFFFAVFLSVTYLLSFALAFHDAGLRERSRQERERICTLYGGS